MSALDFFLLTAGTFFVVSTLAILVLAVVLVRLHRVERLKEEDRLRDQREQFYLHPAARRTEGR